MTGKKNGSGGNGKSNGKKAGKPDVEKVIKDLDLKLPEVLSSYMTAKNMPQEYKFIETYVNSIRVRLIDEAGGNLSQLQMLMLDGICETLTVLKYISTYMGEDPGNLICGLNKFGQPVMSDLAIRGFSGLHQVMDKKIKQFNDMTEARSDTMSAREVHRRAIMGPALRTGRQSGSQANNKREE
jgi:hypothetical protein